jgi:hypothetical protein
MMLGAGDLFAFRFSGDDRAIWGDKANVQRDGHR